MIRALTLGFALAALAWPAAAQPAAAPAPVTRIVGTADATSSGQPIVPPSGPLRVTLSETTLPAGGGLSAHKHPYLRYGYILSGRLKVTNLDTGATFEVKAGDLVLDPVDQWHEAAVMGDEPVRILTLDQAPPGAPTIIRREP